MLPPLPVMVGPVPTIQSATSLVLAKFQDRTAIISGRPCHSMDPRASQGSPEDDKSRTTNDRNPPQQKPPPQFHVNQREVEVAGSKHLPRLQTHQFNPQQPQLWPPLQSWPRRVLAPSSSAWLYPD